MEFKEGASVITTDDKVAGHLQRVVIDPDTNQVTHIVIRRGLLDKVDLVIDAQNIGAASPEKVTLLCTADDIQSMPPFKITQYAPAPGQVDSTAPALYPNTLVTPPVVTETNRTIPEELIALKEGASVFSHDREHVGDVRRVITDPEGGQVTRFVIAKGLLFKENKSIPFEWVDQLGEDEVSLTVDSQRVKELPGFQD